MSLTAQVLAHFTSKHLALSDRYITSLLTAIRPPPTTSTPALLTTLQTTFLQTPLHQSAAPQSHLPPSLPQKHDTSIPGPTLVQVIHVEDIGMSRLAQLEALEKVITERGPQGLRVVELPPEEEDEGRAVQNGVGEGVSIGKSMCKVLLEDGAGQRVYGMEVKSIEGIKVGMPLGTKVPSSPFEAFWGG
jgi:RecQ-mediated genome instability protein 1